MSAAPRAPARPSGAAPLLLLRAAHGGPALAVTAIAALLALGRSLPAAGVLAVTGAVLAGQLTIGWGNDLADAGRDRASGRRDKPLATGRLRRRTVLSASAVAAVACVVLSLLAGWAAALVHLPLVVGAGHAYNLFLKATPWSWLPYAVAFGSLPAVVWLTGESPDLPPGWMLVTGAALGVGAHLLNALPDLADDERTGVRGLPHRLGARGARGLAVVLLVGATVAAVLGPVGAPPAWAWGALALVGLLGIAALRGTGRNPFRAAVTIALVDVALLVVSG